MPLDNLLRVQLDSTVFSLGHLQTCVDVFSAIFKIHGNNSQFSFFLLLLRTSHHAQTRRQCPTILLTKINRFSFSPSLTLYGYFLCAVPWFRSRLMATFCRIGFFMHVASIPWPNPLIYSHNSRCILTRERLGNRPRVTSSSSYITLPSSSPRCIH